LFFLRPRFEEWSLLLPLITWAVFLMQSRISIGWRHFLPAYVFLLMLAARVILARGIFWTIASWACVAIVAVHATLWHPDYLSYLNWPRKAAYLAINDSNIDWGQGLKEVRGW